MQARAEPRTQQPAAAPNAHLQMVAADPHGAGPHHRVQRAPVAGNLQQHALRRRKRRAAGPHEGGWAGRAQHPGPLLNLNPTSFWPINRATNKPATIWSTPLPPAGQCWWSPLAGTIPSITRVNPANLTEHKHSPPAGPCQWCRPGGPRPGTAPARPAAPRPAGGRPPRPDRLSRAQSQGC